MTHPIRTVLFDLDGTLLDSIRLIVDAFHHMMERHHGRRVDERVWLDGVGTPLVKQIAELAEHDAQAEEMLATYRAYCVDNHDHAVSAYAGMPEAVRALDAQGMKLGIVTSKRRVGAFRGLATMQLTEHFPVVLGVDDVEHPKPHPRPVLKAIELLDADPETTVFIGDSTHDMECGRAAGVRTAAVLWGPFSRASLEPHEPTWWVEHPDALLDVLGL